MQFMRREHFVNNALSELEKANWSPIDGYQHLPIQTLEEVTKKLIELKFVMETDVLKAKNNCRSSDLLTKDESAAIYLYTMPCSFFTRLNETLRAENRNALEPWFAFLKLFITALEKLPSIEETVWRGVQNDVGSIFDDGDVHTWWSVNSCTIDIRLVQVYLGNSGTIFVIDAVHGKNIAEFSVVPHEKEIVLMPGTRVRATSQLLNFIDRFFLVYLKEDSYQSYICNLIKRTYQENSRILLIMDQTKSFPIKDSYINLAIVETKKLADVAFSTEIIGTYEEIYGTKTKIEVKDIFEKCNNQIKKILIFGRAGIGKTTFCRYAAYQWATGVIWRQYQLVIVIHLRNLTGSRYPPLSPGNKYSFIDLVKTEYCCENLSDNDINVFNEQLNNNQVLWLLDGYDEIVQSIPAHLEHLLEQLLETSHHILTSRPYLNTLTYKLEMEIIGFTDDNIQKYVTQFFAQYIDKKDNASVQSKKLLKFFKYNPRIWGILHIPVNLELICSLWGDTNWSNTRMLTMATIYDKIVEWLCRRYLERQNKLTVGLEKNDVYQYCDKELAFLETLAFHGIQENIIILPQKLLEETERETGYFLNNSSQLRDVGILKSLDDRSIHTHNDVEKNYYFLHLSFQEHFTARYLVNALNHETDKIKAINFIKVYKYNKRFELVFIFASGLLNDNNAEQSMNLFWKILLEEPLDIIGIRHIQLIICCTDENGCSTCLSHYEEFMTIVIDLIRYSVSKKHHDRHNPLIVALQRSPILVNQTEILDMFVELCKSEDSVINKSAYLLFSKLPIMNSREDLIDLHLTALRNGDEQVKCSACEALGSFDENIATYAIINGLVQSAYSDRGFYARRSAREALCKIGETATTDEIINRLVSALDNTSDSVRIDVRKIQEQTSEKATISEKINRLVGILDNTSYRMRNHLFAALNKFCENITINELINRLVRTLDNSNDDEKKDLCKILNELGGKVATNEIINRLGDIVLMNSNVEVRRMACQALGKMSNKVAIKEMINKIVSTFSDKDRGVQLRLDILLSKIGKISAIDKIIHSLENALEDTDSTVRMYACEALGKMGEKAATNEIINRLVNAVGDTDSVVRTYACKALDKMGEKATTNEIINKLVSMHSYKNDEITRSAYNLLAQICLKSKTNEIVDIFGNALEDTNSVVRKYACEALNKIGEKAATNEIINRLGNILDDSDYLITVWAYDALTNMNEKAATNEIVNKLLTKASSKDSNIRRSACKALGKIGVKQATNDLIRILLDASYDDDDEREVRYEVVDTLERILELSPNMSHLEKDTVGKLLELLNKLEWQYVPNISPVKSMRAFLDTDIFCWLPIIKRICIRQGYAIVITANTVVKYDHKESVTFSLPNSELEKKLRNYFVNWLKKTSEEVDSYMVSEETRWINYTFPRYKGRSYETN